MTQRRLLQIVPAADLLLDLTSDELAWAMLEDMQVREHDQTAGIANRDSPASSLTPVSFRPTPQQHEVMSRIDKVGRNAFALLEFCQRPRQFAWSTEFGLR